MKKAPQKKQANRYKNERASEFVAFKKRVKPCYA